MLILNITGFTKKRENVQYEIILGWMFYGPKLIWQVMQGWKQNGKKATERVRRK